MTNTTTDVRAAARTSAARLLGGDPMPARNYGLDPDSRISFTWTHRTETALIMGNIELLAWMWRHCPDIPADLYEDRPLPEVIDAALSEAIRRKNRDRA